MSVTYLDSILDGGIANPNFFNGRVLTAQDLRDAQRADRDRVRRLGQMLEPGVAAGLMVGRTNDNRDLTVSAGLALNRLGATLLLPRDVVLPLVGTEPESAGSDSPFGPCSPADPTLVGGVASGFYLLAITAATGLSTSRAPTSSLNGGDVACAARYEMDGVQLKLITLPAVLPDGTSWQQGQPTTWRSRLVAACFGLPGLLSLAPDPFAAPARYGLVDQLRANGTLLDCDVPLAVLRWLNQGVEMIDQWAVRRACALTAGLGAYPPPSGASSIAEPFPQHAANRRLIEAQALMLQFQAQLEELRTTLADPPATAATTHFAHLPAAGYLPLTAEGRPDGFRWPTFFARPETPPPTELDPAYLRDLFHRSFFVDPIALANGPEIDLFTVLGTDPARPYVVFARRQRFPVTAPVEPTPEPEEPPEDEPPAPTPRPATLVVIVTDARGRTLTVNQIDEIIATTRGRSFPPDVYDQAGSFDWGLVGKIAQEVAEAERSGATYQASASGGTRAPARASASEASTRATTGRSQAATATSSRRTWGGANLVAESRYRYGAALNDRRAAIFIFRSLPAPADYVVRVVAVRGGLVRSVSVHLEPGESRVITISLRKYEVPPEKIPGKVKPGEPFVIPNGWAFDHGYIDPRWERDPRRPDERWTDPPPDDWRVDVPPEVVEAFAAELENWAADDPTIASEGPSVYVRPDYSPAESYPEPYAFVRTGDGRFLPMVLVPGENAAGVDLPPGRAGLADLDAAADAALQANGLPTLDAAVGAWTGLLGVALGLQDAGAASLQAEARDVATGIQGTFLGFPGVTPDANRALLDAFGDLVGLANASPAAVQAALGEQFNAGFVSRLIDRARGTVSAESWSLDSLDLGADREGALHGMGIDTVGNLLDRAGAEGRNQLQDALNLDAQSLDRLLDRAAAGQEAGRLTQQPERGVAALPGMTPERAEALVSLGLGTESKLAVADRETVAQRLNIAVDEAGALQAGAVEAGRTGLALENLPGMTQEQAESLHAEGIGSIGDLLRVDAATVTRALGDNAVLAGRVRESARTIATRVGAVSRGFRGGP